MKSKVRIIVNSLYPKRYCDKVFEISIKRLKGVKGSVVFSWKNIQEIGTMDMFHLTRYLFLKKLFDYYVSF